MRHLYASRVSFALLLVLLAAVGCNKSSTPPAPLAIEQLPAALEKAFTKAKPEIKSLASQIISSVQAKDFAKAYLDLQSLSGMTGLSQEQHSIAMRGALTVNELVQSAAAKGDETAAEAVKVYKSTK